MMVADYFGDAAGVEVECGQVARLFPGACIRSPEGGSRTDSARAADPA
jgi:hypothetical protein